MDMTDTTTPLTFLENLAVEANEYFTQCSSALLSPRERYYNDHRLIELPEDLQRRSRILSEKIALFAMKIGPQLRRAPLLTEADEVAVGHAIKGMRAALRLKHYKHWDVDVLHDEGIVLGVRRAGDSDEANIQTAEEAKSIFYKRAEELHDRLQLLNTAPDADIGAKSTVVSTGALAPGIRRDTAFIIMRIAKELPELEDVCITVKRCFNKFGIVAVRSDDIEHEDMITRRIIEEIKTAEFLFADLSGERPSVYYEIGYAHALGRRVIMFRKAETKIHFDLAAFNCPEYKNLAELETQLTKRLEVITGKTGK